MRPGRSQLTATDEKMGPGTYNVKGQNFGDNTRGIAINKNMKPARVEKSPGPGEYDADRMDSPARHRSPAQVDYSKMSGRKEPDQGNDDPDVPPPERFYNYPQSPPNYSMGEVRP